eukprot:m.300007 g.300007  ORF g.300007 m.300007 type:complete len:578 (+) comp19552_c0_seq7:55-1788(+)
MKKRRTKMAAHTVVVLLSLATTAVLVADATFRAAVNSQTRPSFHYSASTGWVGAAVPLWSPLDSKYHMFAVCNPASTTPPAPQNYSYCHATSPELMQWTDEAIGVSGVNGTGSVVIVNATKPVSVLVASGGSLALSTDAGLLKWTRTGVATLPLPAGVAARGDVFVYATTPTEMQLVMGTSVGGQAAALAYTAPATNLASWMYQATLFAASASMGLGPIMQAPSYFALNGVMVLMFTASSGQSHWLVGSGTDQAFTLLQQGFVDHGSATLAKPLRTALNEVLVFARIVDPRSAAAQAAAGATGIQSLPRKLTVTNNQLFFQPAAEVSARESDHLRFTGIQLQGNGTWDIAAPFSPNRYHVRLSVTLAKADAGVAGGIRLLKSANQSEHTTVKVAFNGTDPCSTGNVKFHPGMDMPGNDISGTPVSGADANPEACFKSCCSNRDCVAFVYVTSQPGSGQPYCWLKRTVGGTHPLAVANYGIVRTGSAEYTLDTTQSTLDTTVSTGKFVGPDVLDVTKPTVLDVYVDGPVVEVYGPGGAVVLSALVFPTLPTQPGITLFSEGGGASFDVDIWSLEGDAS